MNLPSLFIGIRIGALVAATSLSPFGAISNVHARVTAFFSAGATCADAPSANFVAGGPAIKISLCVRATSEALCGHTVKLQASDPDESARFHVTAVALGPNYADPNNKLIFPVAITNPPAIADFGGTVSRAAVSTTAKQLLVTFAVHPQVNATKNVYVLNLSAASSVSVSEGAACTMPTDLPIAASFRLVHRLPAATRK